jgi:hypothetical protein
MKNILLQWTYYADIISVPNNIAENLAYYQQAFDKWLCNKENKHNYWVVITSDDGPMDALSFSSDAFILWLNNMINDSDQKVTYVAKEIQPTNDQKKLPTIFF